MHRRRLRVDRGQRGPRHAPPTLAGPAGGRADHPQGRPGHPRAKPSQPDRGTPATDLIALNDDSYAAVQDRTTSAVRVMKTTLWAEWAMMPSHALRSRRVPYAPIMPVTTALG